MSFRVIEIAEDKRHLSLNRGFLVVESGAQKLGQVPLDDIAALVINAHGVSYSTNLLLALSDRKAPVIFCAPNHRPSAILWPVDAHHMQAARMQAQIGASRPLQKQLWQNLIQAKIMMQGAALSHLGKPSGAFEMLARKVRSGDPQNIEAQAARRYWPLIFGADFRRDTGGGGINGMLNYGYAILRAGVARAVMAAGLHPTLGVHHHNRNNPMCLVDDVLEPFRPLVDLKVFRLTEKGADAVTREVKADLAGLLIVDMLSRHGTTPLSTCLERLAASLARSYESGKADLDLPLAPLPLDLMANPRLGRSGEESEEG